MKPLISCFETVKKTHKEYKLGNKARKFASWDIFLHIVSENLEILLHVSKKEEWPLMTSKTHSALGLHYEFRKRKEKKRKDNTSDIP